MRLSSLLIGFCALVHGSSAAAQDTPPYCAKYRCKVTLTEHGIREHCDNLGEELCQGKLALASEHQGNSSAVVQRGAKEMTTAMLARINSHPILRRRRLAHRRASYSGSSPWTVLMLVLAVLLTVVGLVVQVTCSCKRPKTPGGRKHGCAYCGCPLGLTCGAGAYVLYVVIIIISVLGSLPEHAFETESEPVGSAGSASGGATCALSGTQCNPSCADHYVAGWSGASTATTTTASAPASTNSTNSTSRRLDATGWPHVTCDSASATACCSCNVARPSWVDGSGPYSMPILEDEAVGGCCRPGNPPDNFPEEQVPLVPADICHATMNIPLASCRIDGAPCAAEKTPMDMSALFGMQSFVEKTIGYTVQSFFPSGGLEFPVAQEVAWIDSDLATELEGFPRSMGDNGEIYHQRFHLEALFPFAYQQERFTFPATFQMDGLENFTMSSRTSAGLTFTARMEGAMQVQGTPFYPSPVTWGGSIETRGFEAGFELAIRQPILSHTSDGLSARFHQVELTIMISVPSARFVNVHLHASNDYCGSDWFYICRGIHDVAIGVTRDVFEGVMNGIFEDGGLNQFTGGGLEIPIDLTADINGEAANSFRVEHTAFDGMCTFLAGCDGKSIKQLIASAQIIIPLTIVMFILVGLGAILSCVGCCVYGCAPKAGNATSTTVVSASASSAVSTASASSEASSPPPVVASAVASASALPVATPVSISALPVATPVSKPEAVKVVMPQAASPFAPAPEGFLTISFESAKPVGMGLKWDDECGATIVTSVDKESAAAHVPLATKILGVAGESCIGKTKNDVLAMVKAAKANGPTFTITFDIEDGEEML